MRTRTAKQWIKEVLNIEMPDGDIGGEWFAENDLPMIVKCTCCEMSMALPSAMVNDAGETFCPSCVEQAGTPVLFLFFFQRRASHRFAPNFILYHPAKDLSRGF